MHAKRQGVGVQDNQLSFVYYDGTTDYRPTHIPFASSAYWISLTLCNLSNMTITAFCQTFKHLYASKLQDAIMCQRPNNSRLLWFSAISLQVCSPSA